jgi:hypothetical protein
MEDIKYIHKNIIPFFKKINVLLIIYAVDKKKSTEIETKKLEY